MKLKLKRILNYISTVLSWSLFVALVSLAAFLFYYFISLKIYEKKGYNYRPGISIYTIVSPSMVPTIDVYDIVLNKKISSPEEIEVGDIITFISTSSISNGLTITHRVVNKFPSNGSYKYVTKGDNNLSNDTMPADYENVIGKAFMRLPQAGRIQFFLATKAGWLMVVVIPSLIIIIKDVIRLVNVINIRKQAQLANLNLLNKEEDKPNPDNNGKTTPEET